ncbi:hypothetical protein EII41_13560 [Tannerella forsythia]|uniref:Uncharacterized protein n=2 Tax=Tannerella forsythia TaxID=28112 RepID=A0A3P1YFR1_TANFO|nr:hypothetical protein EII41_13560 [Tannerella forsythia]
MSKTRHTIKAYLYDNLLTPDPAAYSGIRKTAFGQMIRIAFRTLGQCARTLRGGSHTPCEVARMHHARWLAYTLRGGSHTPCEVGRIHPARRLARTLRGNAHRHARYERENQ